MLSQFLKDRIAIARSLVDELSKDYAYVSIFGRHAKGRQYVVTSKQVRAGDATSLTSSDAGFVIKVYNEDHYSEYSCDDIKGLATEDIKEALALTRSVPCVEVGVLKDEPLVKSFVREDEEVLSENEILDYLRKYKDEAMAYDQRIVEAQMVFTKREISNIFVSKNRQLDQYYTYNNGIVMIVANQDSKIQSSYDVSYGVNSKTVLEELGAKIAFNAKLAVDLLKAKTIPAGYYDVITHPSISGLIAHEAFGHGVEMDMFVKNRAKAKDYVGKRVASDLVNMHDGASATLSAASYFFDDDGVLAHDTTIIEKGILKNGISDVLSALELKTEPTGNSRRESSRRKAYTRMTNTFFLAGNDKLEDMIKSIKHGFYLCQTSNGMEDPKNWQIQCTAQYAYEIVDGKITDHIFAPVVMSGYVPDLLNSISMVSDKCEVTGSGMCGKGHKEWVYVADGGPYLKAKVKLG